MSDGETEKEPLFEAYGQVTASWEAKVVGCLVA